MAPIGSGIIRRSGFVGVGVWPCWRKCITVEVDFEASYAHVMPSVEHGLRLLSADQEIMESS